MQKFDNRSLIYGTIGTQERVLVRQGKQAIRIRAIEVLLYIRVVMHLKGADELVNNEDSDKNAPSYSLI